MSGSDSWPEVEDALRLGKREAIVKGDREGKPRTSLPDELFVDRFTLISISGTAVERVPERVGALAGLRELLLFSNRIASVDPAVSRLKELRVLDLSRNRLVRVPPELDRLPELASLNLSDNAVEELPAFAFPALRELNLSNNRLADFSPVCSKASPHLADLNLSSNAITAIPAAVAAMPALKRLDLSANQISTVPREAALAPRLKELELKGNRLADNRLTKLVNQCRPKQILDYVKQNCPKAGADEGAKGGRRAPAAAAAVPEPEPEEAAQEPELDTMVVVKADDDTPNVKIDERAKTVRAHIVCCTVEGLEFTEESFKKFIQIQTKLHDGLCERRNAATIATHDADKIPPGDLLYTARPPHSVKIQPLGRNKVYSGLELYGRLRKEAEDLRKEKKRNALSGIHKYLYLLEGKQLYPCLEDSQENVISFPPITNGEITKMTHETKRMLVEVTSSQNQTICRKVLDALLLETLNMGVGGKAVPDEGPNNRLGVCHRLRIKQTRIVDLEGKMRVVYPSKVDLFYEDKKTLKILRE